MNVHETYAELERVRRELVTARYELANVSNPDHGPGRHRRLEQAEARERDLVRQLAESTASKR